jgi:hypothetical protein
MDLQRILNTPPTLRRLPSIIPETPLPTPRRLPSKIPETQSPITPLSRASTQSLSPPRSSVHAIQDSLSSNNSFETVTTFVTSTPPGTPHQTTHNERIQIQTALLFKVPWKEI